MRFTKHILVLLVMALAMSAYLYSYKPRDNNWAELLSGFAYNATLWFFIFAIPYLVLGLVFTFLKRHFAK